MNWRNPDLIGAIALVVVLGFIGVGLIAALCGGIS